MNKTKFIKKCTVWTIWFLSFAFTHCTIWYKIFNLILLKVWSLPSKFILIICKPHLKNFYEGELSQWRHLTAYTAPQKHESTLLYTRHPEKYWNTEKNAQLWDPYFLIRHAPGITKIPKWKYSICIQPRKYDFLDLCTE